MPDFNKGDFTQQGVNGHVNATVRLNEKRLVSIDMTSNEEAEGCTITGTVKDLLNDKVYNIGSGGGGGGDFVYIVNEDVVIDENHTGTVSNVDTSEISHVDNVLCYIKINVDELFSIGLYTYVAEDDQSLDVKTYDGADFHVFTEDGITWQADVSPIASATIKLVIIKMPDFYSAN